MKNKKVFKFISIKILVIFLIFSVILLCIKILKNSKDFSGFQEDIIFFKLFDNANTQDESSKKQNTNKTNYEVSTVPQYRFEVKYENIKLQDINLANTVNYDTLIKEKIAPGTSGNFNLILISTQDIDYQVKFESKNEKPKNLKFFVDGMKQEFNSLEELQQILQGHLYAKEEKIIKINWKWDYENSDIGNRQDTEDSKNIFQYNFEVKVLGKNTLKNS